MATDIVIASAARTPIGSFNGAFGAVPAHDLGKVAIKGALERAKVKPEEVDEVIMGQILSAAQGQNPARQAAVNSGIPVEKTALGINQLCGSGLRAVAFGWQAIRNGDASIMVVGGQESMSQAPHAGYMRDGTKMGEFKMVDTMLKDGLWDAFHGYHMGNTAENVAQKFQITRAEQDAFAASSQNKAEAAQKALLVPIVCVGETRDEREAGKALAIVKKQLRGSVPDGSTGATLVVAYEPVWAIGTGLTPTAADVAEMHAAIRTELGRLLGKAEAAGVRLLYGGSVKPANAAELMNVAHVDGALVGGDSLKAEDFLAIARACAG